jgi:DNA-directed RNA polymerase subunit N (RpoN/RPB10)
MLLPNCPTCGTSFSNKELKLEERKTEITNNNKISEQEKQKRIAVLLNDLKFDNLCCKMRALTYVDVVYLVK